MQPSLDLVAQALQLLNLRLEVRLELLFLPLTGGRLQLVVQALEELDALRDLLEGPVNLRCACQGCPPDIATHSAASEPPSSADDPCSKRDVRGLTDRVW